MMDTLFLKLLNMSITASYFILGILLLRLLFRKIPKWISVLLWGLVALRLLLPFSIESNQSLIPTTDPIPQSVLSPTEIAFDHVIPTMNIADTSGVSSTPMVPDPPTATTIIPHSLGGNLAHLGAKLWLPGILVMVGYSIFSY